MAEPQMRGSNGAPESPPVEPPRDGRERRRPTEGAVDAKAARPGAGLWIGSIFGIPIYLHPSWFIIFVLITLSLSTQFNSEHPGWTERQHLALGLITSVLFFLSVLFHELSHSVVALAYKVKVASITLFIFGGISRIEQEPKNAKQEFTISIAGPLSSLFLAGCFWLVWHFAPAEEMVRAATRWLAWVNLLLGLFNLVPGFPLDGGRILRGVAWGITGNFERATRVAAGTGQLFAYGMIVFGIFQALHGNWLGGVWTAFIGWFLLSAAQESYAQVAFRNVLNGVSAGDIMSHEVPTVPRDMSLEEYVHEVLRTGRRSHIVTGMDKPVGFVTLHAARTAPKEEWANTSIQAVMMPIDSVHWASPAEPAMAVLERMMKEDINQMPVISGGQIVGIVARDAILGLLQTRMKVGRLAEH